VEMNKSANVILLSWRFILLLQLFILNTSLVANASSPVPVSLTQETDEFSVTRKHVQYFEDPTANLTLTDILKIADSEAYFKISTYQDLINFTTTSAYWLKFSIHLPPTNTKDYLIEMFDFDIEEVSLYYPDGEGGFIELKEGFEFAFNKRDIPHKNLTFPIYFKSNEPVTVYMRFHSSGSVLLEPIIRSYTRFIGYGLTEYLALGIFYGLLLFMVLYNLISFSIIRKAYYLHYVFFAGSVLLYFTADNGTGFQFLWPDKPELNSFISFTGLFLSTLAMLKFFMTFFDLKRLYPTIHKELLIFGAIRVALFLIQLNYPAFEYMEIIDFIYFQIILFYSIKLYRKKTDSAKWFIIAFSLFNFSCLVSILEIANLIPSGITTVYSINAGVILQFVFLSTGIAETVRALDKEKNEAQSRLIVQLKQNETLKEKVNRELEEKVSERTKELQLAKLEIEKKAEENYNMSVALDIANNKLKKSITYFAKNVVTSSHVDFEEFKKAFPDDFSCEKYLQEFKEKRGFSCKMCGNDKPIKGKARFDIRCAKCNYNESLTANTIFHKTKFSLQKAFYMLYLVSQTKTNISAAELSKILDLQNATCQNFKNKIQERMGKEKKLKTWDQLIPSQLSKKSE
jgi:hypothetical protein